MIKSTEIIFKILIYEKKPNFNIQSKRPPHLLDINVNIHVYVLKNKFFVGCYFELNNY